MTRYLLLLCFFVTACATVEADLDPIPCNYHSDCPFGEQACTDGICESVADPDCTVDAECAAPDLCFGTTGARCLAGRCNYAATTCDDPPVDFCSVDDLTYVGHPAVGACETTSGDCIYSPVQVACADCVDNCLGGCEGIDCTPTVECQTGGVCIPEDPPRCQYQAVADGLPCMLADDPPFEPSGTCVAGECTGCSEDDDCIGAPAQCEQLSPQTTCQGSGTTGACTEGVCEYLPSPQDDVCDGETLECPNNFAAIICTADGDQPVASCPTVCADDNECREGFECVATACVPEACDVGNPCDDGDPCTWDESCDALSQCSTTTTPLTCSPGGCVATSVCDGTDACDETYVGAGNNCDDGDPCTWDETCDGFGGCGTVTAPLVCTPGLCVATSVCDGSNQCDETFDGSTVGCNDGDPCTWDETCDGSGGCGTATTPLLCETRTCVTGSVCDGTATCDETFASDVTPCDDFDDCTYNDTCDGAGTCEVSGPLNCPGLDSPDDCGLKYTCDGTDTCAGAYPDSSTPCTDGDPCTEGSFCDGSGTCGTPCGGTDVCYPGVGCLPPPVMSYTASSVNLGLGHTIGFTISGPPNGIFAIYDRRASCAGSFEAGLITALDGTGSFVGSSTRPAEINCEGSEDAGHWESYVVVGGHTSATVTQTRYNSTCYDTPTWRAHHNVSAAGNYCNACDTTATPHLGDGCAEGWYCDVYSAGFGAATCKEPYIENTEDSAGGCYNWALAGTLGYSIYGPFDARAQKNHDRVTCTVVPSDPAVRIGSLTLNGTHYPDNCPDPENPEARCGYHQYIADQPIVDCPGADLFGQWSQTATMGWPSEPFRMLTTAAISVWYYNSIGGCFSSCSGIACP